jgi:Ca2+:H+ antiporter
MSIEGTELVHQENMTLIQEEPTLFQKIVREWALAAAALSCLAFALFGDTLLHGLANPVWLVFVFAWLFAVILSASLGVVRHAEGLSRHVGEPFGTLILTLSITGIEVMSITAVMLHGEQNPSLVRDTMFAVVMIIMGGMIGMSLLLGAFRHKELTFNLQGANAYLGVIIPLAVFSLVLPDFTSSSEGPTLTTFQQTMVGVIAAGLFAVFLLIQTGRHRSFFMQPDIEQDHEEEEGTSPLSVHLVLLFAYIAPVVFLVEQLARPVDYVIETMHAPAAIGGVFMAILVATPEGIGGIKAAMRNRLQQSVNIFLGSVLATIGLTVPIMLVISGALGMDLVLGLQPVDLMLLILIFAVSIVTFSSGKTHLLQGAVHLLIFVTFCMLLFNG